MTPQVTTYKFLAAGAVAPFSRFTWPSPGADGAAGAWVEVADGEDLVPCRAGLHLCRVEDLPYWLNEELFEVETAGPLLTGGSCVLSRRARLSRRVSAWSRDTALRFCEECAVAARDLTTAALRRSGEDAAAAELSSCATLSDLVRCGQSFEAAEGAPGRLVGYVADAARWAVRVSDGDWAAATAATALIAAHAASVSGSTAAPAPDPPAAEAERARQARWLTDHVLGARTPDLT